MQIAENQIMEVTETFYYEGEIWCVSEVKSIQRKNRTFYLYTAIGCTAAIEDHVRDFTCSEIISGGNPFI